ncbi:MAG: hypothetical protein M1818_007858 [Claussenomyces sp. TS43310]|nr:MAG: hypothetical protein M1818_007858 [Claussenomyces sp. TS43310]
MSMRGQRFTLDLSDDDSEVPVTAAAGSQPGPAPPMSMDFVGDIVEREATEAKPPTLPTLKSATTGFPEHKKRGTLSAFKQQRISTKHSSRDAAPSAHTATQPTQNAMPRAASNGDIDALERRNIDEENRRRLAAMSEEEIDEERQELLSSLSPSLVESLLRRANLDDGRGDTGTDPVQPDAVQIAAPPTGLAEDPDATSIIRPSGKRITAARTITLEDDAEPKDPGAVQPVSSFTREALADATPAVHFPTAPSAPDLDPSDPSFLENLHTQYFPRLPADPSKLAWMAPLPTHGSVADQESPYYPAQEALAASALRFDFRGGLLPPRIARAVPTTKGLHHHGEAPEAAGYTIPELARLARSAFPAQRCLAFQILGRFLYRLGRGEWGHEGTEMAKGLWRCVKEGKVIETLEEAANAEGGHQGSKTYAIEAAWLWQKGGGHVWKAT